MILTALTFPQGISWVGYLKEDQPELSADRHTVEAFLLTAISDGH
jgi:hypothetical protein